MCGFVFLFFGRVGVSSDQELQAVLVVGLMRGAGGQVGRGNWGPCCRGDIEEGVRSDAGGRRVAESRGGGDAGEVDAEREPRLFQGFLGHGESLQLLLTVGHV